MADGERGLGFEALEDFPCALVRTDADGLVLRANATFCKWLGYAREDVVGKRRLQDFFNIGGRIFHQTHWLPLLQMQGSVSEVKLEMVRADGTTVPMVLNAIRRERDGVLVHDIAAYVAHDRDKYEKELLGSRRKLQAAVEASHEAHEQARDRALVAEQMMGVVSHDLRNPLSTISMGATLLMKLKPTDQQRVVLERIQRATERSSRLISDLLDFTQARLGGGLKVKRRSFPLHDVVHDAVDELSQAFPGRGLHHNTHGAGEWFGDPDRIAQLVGNLVANAVAYGDAARPITVSTTTTDEEALVSVHNWGRPIPSPLLSQIFEPLSRGDEPGEARSLGLGLYIVRQIAKAHGGEVLVSSQGDTGTRFTTRLPRGEEVAAGG
jgi:sigma-B regulation protein RsbU (phosphoserine phosphatase)